MATKMQLPVLAAGYLPLQIAVVLLLLINAIAIGLALFASRENPLARFAPKFLTYELLGVSALIMMLPFYWMVVTSFKDAQTAAAIPPVWTPSQVRQFITSPDGELVSVVPLDVQRKAGTEIRVVPREYFNFKAVTIGDYTVVREVAEEDKIFKADPALFESQTVLSLDLKNFRRAWHRPGETSRGQVSFFTYFYVSIVTSLIATAGTLLTSALAAFAFARLNFFGKNVLFYVVLATMMVPGQVLLIPNFLILSAAGMLDSYAALTVPWLASVFTIFLMRQFFMTIPEDLWDAARIDGASRLRYLAQIVIPLSVPVFITAGIFDFLNNWNSLLWPLIVNSSPSKRTLMVGLQNLSDEAGSEFHLLMAASTFAILPVVILFFVLQRHFIEGIARTGLK
jgi:multiple sugar transport system permease protein